MTLIKWLKSRTHLIIKAASFALACPLFVMIPAPASAAVRSCTSSTPVASRPTLYSGDTGTCVSEAQRLLNLRLGTSLVRDGSFGPATLSAVKTYQSRNGISQTGNVGPITWGKLVSGTTVAPPSPPVTVTPTRSNCYNSSSVVNVSFDDTANDTALNSILATLKAKNVRAIFFFNTSNTSLAKFAKIRSEGHLVANHTYSHPNLRTLSASGVKSQVTRGRTTYTNSPLVRPPFGATNSTVSSVITSLGYKECLWTVDTMDWSSTATTSASSIVNRVKYGDSYSPRVYAGGMVLMHGSARYTPAALSGVIDAIRWRGYALPRLR